jgi:hypothetical protein
MPRVAYYYDGRSLSPFLFGFLLADSLTCLPISTTDDVGAYAYAVSI